MTDDGFEKIPKEVAVVYQGILLVICLMGPSITMKMISHSSRCFGRDSNRIPHE
jgi:hypothetical protein